MRATLERSGLQVGRPSVDGLSLPARGTAAEVEGAFATGLERVALPHRRSAYADVEDPTLSAAASPDVQGVIGLDSLPIAHPEGLVRAGASQGGHPHGELAASADGPSTCIAAQAAGDTAQEIASAYGIDGLWSAGDVGAGTTVALFELEPFSPSDVAAYQSCYGTDATVQTTPVDGFASAGSGSGEAALDIEDVIGLAPGARIRRLRGTEHLPGQLRHL